jgi:hypothetical protein
MPTARRFSASLPTIHRDLQAVLRKMRATGLRITQALDERGAEAAIQFDRAGRRYVVRCARYAHPDDNLRAAQLAIRYLYDAMEALGVASSDQAIARAGGATSGPHAAPDAFAQFFLGFEAVPDDTVLMLGSGSDAWWEVLGIERTATKMDIQNAYRALSKVHHPDAGGDAERFRRLRAAYDAAIKARG